MKTMQNIILFIFAAILLTACTSTKIAPAGPYEMKSYTVDLASDWNAIPIRTDRGTRGIVLTKDGPALNSVYLYSDIKPGDGLVNEIRRDQPVPKFSEDMFELELVEFLVNSLERGAGLKGVETDNVRPDSFNGADAVRFDLMGRTGNGLNVEGEAMMAVVDGKLNIIFFIAPSEYYAARYQSDVDAIFASVSDE